MTEQHKFKQPPKVKGRAQTKATWKFDPLFIEALRGFTTKQTALNGFKVSMPNVIQTAVFRAYPAVHAKYKLLQDIKEKKDDELRKASHQAIDNYEAKKAIIESGSDEEEEVADPGGVNITIRENWRDKPPLKERLEALGLKSQAMINALINVVTGKPFLDNLNDNELEVLSKTLDTFESGERVLPDSWYAAGHPPAKPGTEVAP
jgi:hypothetical protein